MKFTHLVLVFLAATFLGANAFAQPSLPRPIDGGGHVESFTRNQLAAAERSGLSVDIGEVAFDVGAAEYSISGSAVCTDGTYLRAGKMKVCETNDGQEPAGGVSDCTGGKIKTYDLKTPIYSQEEVSTFDGAIPGSDDGKMFATKQALSLAVSIYDSSDNVACDSRHCANPVKTGRYSIPTCAVAR